MRLPGENEERGKRLSLKYTLMGASMSILFVLGIALLMDDGKEEKKTDDTAVMALDYGEAADEAGGEINGGVNGEAGGETAGKPGKEGDGLTEEEPAGQPEEEPAGQPLYDENGREKDIEKLYREHRLTASDLDFWDMYPKENPELVRIEEEGSENENGEEGEEGGEKEGEKASGTKNKYEEAEKREEEKEKEKPENDGKHTLLTYADGSEEWVLINPYLEKNTYDFTRLTMKADQMAYYEDGKKSSLLGADLSKYNGSVDFARMKEAGIDFVMIRLGARGYGSGQIVLDEKFTEHMTRAAEAGLDIGVYFFSQAVTVEEAVEEAAFVVQNLSAYRITYPIAFDMEYVENDTSRIEALSREEKTAVAKAFLEEIKKAGYKPMLYGNKEWLVKQVDLTRLTGYDVWLSQQKDMPDYPYQFQMWQYTLDGSVSGVEGDVNLNVSFVDYTEK